MQLIKRQLAKPYVHGKRDVLSHWAWCLPILIALAFLSLRQIDWYPPTTDEVHSSMNSVGWLSDGQKSPLELISALYEETPEHVPGYFLLLQAWGYFTPHDLATGRILTAFCGLLSAAMVVRLARDFVHPVAGIFAIIMVASNSFHNFYLAHLRMYSLMVFASTLVLWIYLRIIYRSRVVRLRDYATLAGTTFLLASTHIFSVLFLAVLGIHHLVFVPKRRRWWGISIAVGIAVILISPYLFGAIPQGIDRTVAHWGIVRADALQAILFWLKTSSSNHPGLLLASIAGLAIGIWKRRLPFHSYYVIPLLYAICLGVFAEATSLISTYSMRHHLAGWIALVLVASAGCYSLYTFRRWLGLLIVFWVWAGLSFQTSANWTQYLYAGHVTPYSLPAYHAVSRLALQSGRVPHVVGIPYHPRTLDYGYSQFTTEEHFFGKHGIHLEFIHNTSKETLADHLRWNARFEPVIWLFYQTSKIDAPQVAELAAAIETLHYRLCNTVDLGFDTLVRLYAWVTFGCETTRPAANHRTQLLEYEFYGATLDEAASRLFFSDAWTAAELSALNDYRMSYQLISPEWDKVAQLDLPLVDPEESRIFYIDVSDVPAGSYRLMAILYNRHTGERISWLENDGNTPDILALADVRLQ